MPATPAYGGPPKALEALLERHQSPPQAATLSQTQETNSQAAAAAGEQREPGWSFITTGPSADVGASETAGTTDAQPPPTMGQANEHNSNTGHDEDSGSLRPSAASTEDDHAKLVAGAKQRRIVATPEGHISLRMCPRYGAMMGATSVSRDEIAKTTREYDPGFVRIDSSDSSSMLHATQLLMRIEMTAAEQSLTMKECNNIAATHGTQHAWAEAGGKLIRTVMQWESEDAAAAAPSRERAPLMPTLLGGTNAAAAPAEQGDDAHTRGDGTWSVGATTMEEDEHRAA